MGRLARMSTRQIARPAQSMSFKKYKDIRAEIR
jgi:hypothetical protein